MSQSHRVMGVRMPTEMYQEFNVACNKYRINKTALLRDYMSWVAKKINRAVELEAEGKDGNLLIMEVLDHDYNRHSFEQMKRGSDYATE